MNCKSCGKSLAITRAVRDQGWVECGACHAIFSVAREEDAAPAAGHEASSGAPAAQETRMSGSQAGTGGPAGRTGDQPVEFPRTPEEAASFARSLGSPAGQDGKAPGRMMQLIQRMVELAQQQSRHELPPAGPREVVQLPRGMALDRGSDLVITRRWLSSLAFFLLFFTLLWDGFMGIFLYSLASVDDSGFPWFSLLHLAVGAGLTYAVVCQFVNRTTVTVRAGQLEVKHGPLWWPGHKNLDARSLRQVYVRKKVSHSSKGGTSVAYEVEYVAADGRTGSLLGELPRPEQALFIEQQLESFLGIEDTWVSGSYV